MIVAGIAAYLILLAVVGVRQLHKTTTGGDFVSAGRSLAAPVLASTLVAAWIGSGSLFAGAGVGYRVGFAALWQALGAWVAIAIMWRLAPRVREMGVATLPEIFARHYGRTASLLAAATIVIAYTAIVAFQFGAGGRLLALVAGVSPGTGILIVALCCIGMTAVAGLRSVAWIDTVNAVVMILGLGAAVLYLSGVQSARDLTLRPEQLTIFGTLNPITGALALFLPALALLLGDAAMYQKLSAARHERAARWAVAGWLAAAIVAEVLIVTLAVLGSAAVPGLDRDASDTIVIRVALTVLPPMLGVLLAAAAAAIVVATANSFLLAAASVIARDLWIARYAVASVGIVALVLLQVFAGGLEIALLAFTMYGAVITPPLMAAFFWPRVTRDGAVTGMVAGAATTIAVQLLLPAVPAIFPALLVALAGMVGVSVFLSAKSPSSSPSSGESGR